MNVYLPLYVCVPACPHCGAHGDLCCCAVDCDPNDIICECSQEEQPKDVVGETGGSLEIHTEITDFDLNNICEEWIMLEECLWVRVNMLRELNACWITGEDGNSRKFGTLSDWRGVANFMVWHYSCFVIVNASKMKTFVLEHGDNKAITMGVKQGFRHMRNHASSIGVILFGDDDDNIEWGHVEVCWNPNESVFDKRAFVRDKLTMAVIRLNRHVEFWR